MKELWHRFLIHVEFDLQLFFNHPQSQISSLLGAELVGIAVVVRLAPTLKNPSICYCRPPSFTVPERGYLLIRKLDNRQKSQVQLPH